MRKMLLVKSEAAAAAAATSPVMAIAEDSDRLPLGWATGRRPSWPQLCLLSLAVLSVRNFGVHCDEHPAEIDSISSHHGSHRPGHKAAAIGGPYHQRGSLLSHPAHSAGHLGDNQISGLPFHRPRWHLSGKSPARHWKRSTVSRHWPTDQLTNITPSKPISDDKWSHLARQSNWQQQKLDQEESVFPSAQPSCESPPTSPLDSKRKPLRLKKHSKRQTASSLLQQTLENARMMAALSSINLPCRTEWAEWFPFDLYVADSCARCYHYMPDTAFKPGLKYGYEKYGLLVHETFNSTVRGNDTFTLYYTFSSGALYSKWQQCCHEAIVCCANYHKKYPSLHRAIPMSSASGDGDASSATSSSQPNWWSVVLANQSEVSEMCPPTWDGWLCWDEFARPSQMLEQSCPKHIYWHQLVPPCRGYVTKLCNASGQWFQNNEQNKEWSNYTMCARDDIYARRIQYSLVTNVISICALIPALIIFTYYKQLSSMSRIRLHKHLFTSLLLHAIISALLKWHLLRTTFNRSTAEDHEFAHLPATSTSTAVNSLRIPSLCLVLSVLLRYFRSVNYLWMFNEALYLHQLIKHAFSQPSLRPLIILAYSLPFITTTSYIFARFMTPFSLEPLDETFDHQLYNAQAPSSIFAPDPTSTASDSQFFSSTTNPASGDQAPLTPSLALNAQLNDRVHHALSSLIRSSSTIRQHLHQSSLLQQHSPAPEPESLWWNDLLAGGDGQGGLVTAERLVAEPGEFDDSGGGDGRHKSATDLPPDTDEQHSVLENLDALEDVSSPIEEDNCWLMPSYESWHEWIINVPNLAILIINCFFLMWLLRVLCIKAAATMISNNRSNHGPSSAMVTSSPTQHHLNGCGTGRNHYHQQSVFSRQSILVSLRAAVLLLPLYGLHYLVIVYRPKIENCWLSETYHYLSLSLDGLQGLAISIIFCFANSEIRHLLTRSLQRVGTRQRSTTIYMTEVAPTIRD